jgi:DNA ligase (NAD+)
MNTKTTIDNIIKDPLATLKTLQVSQIVEILEAADKTFFSSSNPMFTDDIYDIVKTYLKQKDPKNAYLKRVGAVIEFNKEKLPYYMGSLDKIKDDEKEVKKWKKAYQGECIVSEKLDGISCLLYYDGTAIKMYSRGDGTEGQNITHILPYIKLDTNKLITERGQKIAIRGELIISRANWKKMEDVGANARNVVAGAIHSKTVNKDVAKYIEFIAYDLMYPRHRLSEGLEMVRNMGIPVVKYINLSDDSEITTDKLSMILQDWRATSAYEIDGIVVYNNTQVHKITSGKNPKYAFAFKSILTQQQAEVIVTDVLWNVSKDRYLKPIVTFNEVSLAGVTIRQATGFNAAYITKNVIGPGSRLIIVRSGDVIPHISQVITQSSSKQPKMPVQEYIWNDTQVDILLKANVKNADHDISSFVHFMQTLNIEGVKQGVITKLYDAGYDTLKQIIHIGIDDLKKIEGFKEKSAEKVFTAISNIKKADCLQLMVASNVFGRSLGPKKLQAIVDRYKYIPSDKPQSLALSVSDLVQVDGIAETSGKQFVESLPKFYAFIDDIGISCVRPVQRAASPARNSPSASNKFVKQFHNKTVVFSGLRNKEWEQLITAAGGRVVTGISGVTDILIVKEHSSTDKMSTKIKKAIDQGITIMTKADVEKILSSL